MTLIDQPDDAPRVHIQLNLDGAVGPIQWSARRAAQMLKILIPRLEEHDFSEDLELGPQISRMTLRAWPDPAEDKRHLETWLLGAMLQELSRGVRASLEESSIVCRIAALDPATRYPVTIVEDMRREIAQTHTPVLLQSLNAVLAGKLGFVAEMDALNRARNCLEHGRGVVRARDCDEGEDLMRLTMPYFALCRRDNAGNVIDIEYGVPLPDAGREDGMVELLLERRSHQFEFRRGEPLTLSHSQVEAMVMGCQLLAVDLGAHLRAYVAGALKPAG